MIKRDFLKRQLEELGRAIAKVIEDASKLKDQGKINEGVILVQETLEHTFHLNIEDILSAPLDDVIEILVKEKKFSATHLSYLGDLLYTATELFDKKNQTENVANLHGKILTIFNYVNQTEKTFSLERDNKIKAIESSQKIK